MTAALQIAQLFSSIAIVLLAAFLIPLAFRLYRRIFAIGVAMRNLERLMGSLQEEAGGLIRASTRIAEQAGDRMDDIEEVSRSVRRWTAHADRVVEDVNDILNPSLMNLAREARVWGAGVSAFARVFAHPAAKNKNGKEYDHVRR